MKYLTWITIPQCSRLLALAASALVASIHAHEADRSRETESQKRRPTTITSPTGFELVLVSAGDFMIGAVDETDALPRELPRHKVTISHDFWLGKYEITREQFVKVLGFDESSYPKRSHGDDDGEWKKFPATSFTWYDAVRFCNALSERERVKPYYEVKEMEKRGNSLIDCKVEVRGGEGYRLPTMAEWEYACRAGTTTTYSFGEDLTGKDANILGIDQDVNKAKLSTVGSYRANGWGIHDMHGNVAEWCFDWADEDYNKSGRAVDPINDKNRLGLKSTRGGCWADPAAMARCSMFSGEKPSTRLNGIGLRVARTAAQAKR